VWQVARRALESSRLFDIDADIGNGEGALLARRRLGLSRLLVSPRRHSCVAGCALMQTKARCLAVLLGDCNYYSVMLNCYVDHTAETGSEIMRLG
jgi:hypothetical protein